MPTKILIIDDDHNILNILKYTLCGYDVECVDNVIDGISRVLSWEPDLILLDLFVPDNVDSLSFIRSLKADPLTSHIPVIFMTGASVLESVDVCFTAGGFDYIHKPFTNEEILHKISVVSNLGRVSHSLKYLMDSDINK
jgi:DNA-binding response OmpR family regulator